MQSFRDPPPKPDWELWSRKQQACLWEAVAVSLDIEPGDSANTIDAGNRKTEYTRRLRLSIDELGGKLPVLDPSPKVNNRDPAYATIDLFEFSALAKKMNWDLPEQFPGRLVDIVSEDGKNTSPGTVIDGKRMVRTPAGGYIPEEQWRAMTTPMREPVPPEVVALQWSANTSAPVPSGPLIPNTTRKKPAWDMWGNITEKSVFEAVALACDIDPIAIEPFKDTEGPSPDLRQFVQRLAVAIEESGKTLHLVAMAPKPCAMPSLFDRVNLAEFSAWAQNLRHPWEIPEGFPGRTDPAKAGVATAKTWPWGPYCDGWIPFLEATVIEFWKDYDPSVDDGKDRRKASVVKFLEDKDVSTTAARAIDTIARPKGWKSGPPKGRPFPKEKRGKK